MAKPSPWPWLKTKLWPREMYRESGATFTVNNPDECAKASKEGWSWFPFDKPWWPVQEELDEIERLRKVGKLEPWPSMEMLDVMETEWEAKQALQHDR